MAARIPILDLQPMKHTEATVARALIHSEIFRGKLLVVPRCHWAGEEADLLAVTMNLRLVDVEIKVSKADLLADPAKDKWWVTKWVPGGRRVRRERGWPPKVWKHYYLMPVAIWRQLKPADVARLPAHSGILVLYDGPSHTGRPFIQSVRRCTPNKKAACISAEDAIDIARLAGLRMWDAILRQTTTH